MAVVGIVIDVALVLAVLIFAIVGLKKGFFKSFFSLFSWVVCLIIAVLVAKYVATWINGIHNFSADIGTAVEGAMSNADATFFGKGVAEFESSQAIVDAIPTGINKILQTLTKSVFSGMDISTLEAETTIGQVVGTSIGGICMIVISGILVFVVLKIVVALLSKLFESLARTKVIGGLNKTLGLVFGVVKAGVIIFAINAALVLLTLVPVVNKTITPLITENTTVEKFVYEKTDELVGKYVINGNIIQTFVSNLWENRK